METIIVSKDAFEALTTKIDKLVEAVNKQSNAQPLEDRWIENSDAAKILAVSKRWLQNRRTLGQIPYSKIEGRIYYRATDIQKLLENNLIKARKDA